MNKYTKLLLVLFSIVASQTYGQAVDILISSYVPSGSFNQVYPTQQKVLNSYANAGFSSVNIVYANIDATLTTANYDVAIINEFYDNTNETTMFISSAQRQIVENFISSGGHVIWIAENFDSYILSGNPAPPNDNAITTINSLYNQNLMIGNYFLFPNMVTADRFHPSNGPGALSPLATVRTSGSHSTLLNVPELNNIYNPAQNDQFGNYFDPCLNSILALFPAQPTSNEGSVIISTEYGLPFYENVNIPIDNNIAALHYNLLTGASMSTINSWSATATNVNQTCNTPPPPPLVECSFDLGNDTAFCPEENINFTLDAGSGQDSYTWQDNSSNQTFTVTDTGLYYCSTSKIDYSINLVENGDFEMGNTSFNSDYTYSSSTNPATCSNGNQIWGIIGCEGTYAVDNNSSAVHNNFANCTDHTGSGDMMIVNGSNIANTKVWCQDITVTQNTDYIFSAWAMSIANVSQTDVSTLHFLINGQQIGNNFSPTLNACDWQEFYANWNSGNNTNITICIESDVISGNNDYAIDDIFFSPICTHSDSIRVSHHPSPVINLGADTSLCFGNNITLDATTNDVSYEWQDNSTNATLNVDQTGMYWVELTSNTTSCTASDSINVTIEAILESTNEDTICEGDSVQLPNNTFVSTAGTYIDTINNNGCLEQVTSTVTVEEYPTVDLPNDTTITEGESVNIAIVNPTANANYEWEDENGDTYSGNPLQVMPDSTTTYYLTGTNSTDRCAVENEITVIVEYIVVEDTLVNIIIPNAFTPNNGDAINNTFKVVNADAFSEIEMKIYNRWGELVHEGINDNHAWNGNINNLEQASDNYTFYIRAIQNGRNEAIYYTGSVMLIR